jgi:hypothetical protein
MLEIAHRSPFFNLSKAVKHDAFCEVVPPLYFIAGSLLPYHYTRLHFFGQDTV